MMVGEGEETEGLRILPRFETSADVSPWNDAVSGVNPDPLSHAVAWDAAHPGKNAPRECARRGAAPILCALGWQAQRAGD